MQNNTGIHSLLRLPLIYTMFQELIGAHRWRKKFIREIVRPADGDKVVDAGCGPAQMLAWMPAVRYVGLDISAAYIENAKRKHGARGTFLVGNTATLRGRKELRDADVVMCCGVLHHLSDDEAIDLLRFSHEQLRRADGVCGGGRFCALEAAWLPEQSRLSHWVVGQDRGKNIRTENEYRALAEQVFPRVKIIPDLHPMRIPYAGLTMECSK